MLIAWALSRTCILSKKNKQLLRFCSLSTQENKKKGKSEWLVCNESKKLKKQENPENG